MDLVDKAHVMSGKSFLQSAESFFFYSVHTQRVWTSLIEPGLSYGDIIGFNLHQEAILQHTYNMGSESNVREKNISYPE